jgi:hypothetical protein
MKIIEHFNNSIENKIELSFIPIVNSMSLMVRGIYQINGIDYVINNKVVEYIGSDLFTDINVEYEYITSLSIPDRSNYDEPQSPSGSNVVVLSDDKEREYRTINKILDDIQVTSNPYSPLLISLLTTSNVNTKPARPPIPPDLCEYIPENLSLYDSDNLPAVPGVEWIDTLSSNIEGVSSSFFPADQCIEQYAENGVYAQPGDLNYAKCGDFNEIEDLYSADWVAAAMFNSAAGINPVAACEGGSLGSPYGQFLWKPIGEHSGNLVILIPPELTPGGTCTANGESLTYTGVGNGGRSHFRGNRPGAAYGTNVKVSFRGGKGSYTWTIPDGACRYNG